MWSTWSLQFWCWRGQDETCIFLMRLDWKIMVETGLFQRFNGQVKDQGAGLAWSSFNLDFMHVF